MTDRTSWGMRCGGIGAKCLTFHGAGEGPSVGTVLGQAVQALGDDLEVFAYCVASCYLFIAQ